MMNVNAFHALASSQCFATSLLLIIQLVQLHLVVHVLASESFALLLPSLSAILRELLFVVRIEVALIRVHRLIFSIISLLDILNTILLRLMVLIYSTSVAPPSGIVLSPVLVAHLSTTLSTTILPSLGETLVQVRPDNALI